MLLAQGHGLTPIECLPMEDADDGFEFKVPGWVIRQNYPNATTLGTKCTPLHCEAVS